MHPPLGRLVTSILFLALLAAGPAAKPAPLEPGLVATYSDGKTQVTRLVATPAFTLGEKESVHPQLGSDFTATYDGTLRILKESDYLFAATDGASVKIDGEDARAAHLRPGDHTIRVTYKRPAGPARLRVTWASTDFPAEPIPASVLGHTTSAPADDFDRGRILAQTLDCVACHQSPGLAPMPAPDLSAIGSRANASWVRRWLENPKHFRTAAAMPVVLTSEQDRRDVAAYLVTLHDPKPSSRPIASNHTGQSLFESVGCVNCHNSAGVALDGQASKWGSPAALSAYLLDPLAIDRSGRMPNMLLDQGQADALAAFLFEKTAQPKYSITPHLPDFEGDAQPGDPSHGRQLVRGAGCLNCHAIKGERSELSARDFAHLTPTAGCLADAPPANVPNYQLSREDRAFLRHYVASVSEHPEVSPAPAYAFEQHARVFNCTACHAADLASAPAIRTDGVPPLSIAGRKLRPEAIRGVLLDKDRVRPWVKAHMPHFGKSVEPLVAELVATSGSPATAEKPEAPTARQVADGRRIVGAAPAGLSCITCHSLNNGPVPAPEQSRGPELTTMTRRLREDWFLRWVREPGRIIPNTVMPSFFANRPADDSYHEIRTIYAYLSLGPAMPTPNGAAQADKTRFVLTPADQPVVQRCWLEGGGANKAFDPIPRAVAVGLPGGLSYAFDPESAQLRYVWTGEFLDMTAGWNGRGNTHGKRLGTPIYTAPDAPDIYLDSLTTKPTRTYRAYEFHGNAVDMVYTINDVEIRERISPAQNGFSRSLTLSPSRHTVYVVLPAAAHPTSTSGTFNPIDTAAGWPPDVHPVALQLSRPTTLSVTLHP